MQLGFVSAILPDLNLEEVLRTAAEIGYDCVELMCWPPGKAARRYAGVTHLDVTDFDVEKVHDLCEKYGVFISALGYYPNPLVADEEAAQIYQRHIRRVIEATAALGLERMTTFVGRDHTRSFDDNWPRFLAAWQPIVAYAKEKNVRIGIENCPMSFGEDEWPGGKNLAVSPAIWDRMYTDISDNHFGLNFDPSHFVLQFMDYEKAIRNYADRLVHVHAKDLRIDREELNHHGVFAHPKLWHTPKLPGLGDVDWGRFVAALNDADYRGPVCVEVEDRAYEGSLEDRLRALRMSYAYLRQFIPGSL
ncbi:AP endonuclease [Lewinellaceae bacterium SD302]|nr:AP endonuclease [Lewinellaceae bacterium SD302]